MGWGEKLKSFFIGDHSTQDAVTVDNLQAYSGQYNYSPYEQSIFDGGKYPGGFGPTQLFQVDYWTLRARSSQLFNDNLYARGLIRRLVTNEISTGLAPEASPDEEILGLPEDSLNDWTEDVETRFGIWGKAPLVCDWKRESTFGAIQQVARREALVSGDVLVVLHISPRTQALAVQLVKGAAIRTPLAFEGEKLRQGHTVQHGVEMDARGRQVAYWAEQKGGGYKRIPAWGEKSGRRLAWLVYGTDKRLDDVRGQPILALVLQSIKEIDRYRDSVQRKATLNAMLAMFIKKGTDKPGTLPLQGGAVRRDSGTVTDGDGTARTFNVSQQIPGMVLDELQEGEEPVGFHNQGTDSSFGEFEAAIISAVAWANEIPPEVLILSYRNNYSASQAAINEFKIYLNRVWSDWGEQFCSPIYSEWLVHEALVGRVQAQGLLEAWRDPKQFYQFGAWIAVDWYGAIKPSTDMVKQAKGSKLLVDECWSTNAREARITTGTKFSKNVKRVKRENELKAEAARPMAEFLRDFGPATSDAALQAVDERILSAVSDAFKEHQQDG